MNIYFASIGLVYIAWTIVRILATRASNRRGHSFGAEEVKEIRRDNRELRLLTISEITVLVLYVLRLPWVAFFQLPFPVWLRFGGLLIALGGVALIAWASYELNGQYSAVVELKKNHQLVTSGPYRHMRHPIYSGIILLHAGVVLLAASWLVLVVWSLGLSLVLLRRIRREEARLQAYFSDHWQRYAAITPRFIPGRKRRE